MPIDDDLFTDAARQAFAISYEDARQRFLGSVSTTRSYPSPATGPQGQELFTDVSWIGPADAREVVVVLSAVHGVEGYCGSAIQVDLARRPPRLGASQAILLVHALNAYGFAWERRVTEEGCDLNRNFVDFSKGAPINAGYLALAEHLLPRSLEPQALQAAENALDHARRIWGEEAFQIARKSGQYVDPKGMFYGGEEPSGPRQILETIAADYDLASRDFVTVVDVHTGLGPYGYGELQTENEPSDISFSLSEAMFGPSLTSPAMGTSYSVPVNGTVQLFWQRLRGDGRYVYACLEYGTFDQEASRRAYRLDHWHHAYGDGRADSPGGVTARAAMRAQFYPEFDDWKAMVLFRARQVVAQALSGMENFR